MNFEKFKNARSKMLTTQMKNAFDGLLSRVNMETLSLRIWQETLAKLKNKEKNSTRTVFKRDGMGKEVGGGFRMGNTCTPVADACLCMAKPIQYFKVTKNNNNKKFKKKKKMCNIYKGCNIHIMGELKGKERIRSNMWSNENWAVS